MSPSRKVKAVFASLLMFLLTVTFTYAAFNSHDYRVNETLPKSIKINKKGEIVQGTVNITPSKYLPKDYLGKSYAEVSSLFSNKGQCNEEKVNDIKDVLVCDFKTGELKKVIFYKDKAVKLRYHATGISKSTDSALYFNRWLGVPMVKKIEYRWLYALNKRTYARLNMEYKDGYSLIDVSTLGYSH